MQLPIFPPVGPTSGEGPERSKPSGEAPTSHKPGDGFLRVFGGMRSGTSGTPGTSKENELGSDPAIGPRLFSDREASGSIHAPDDLAFSLEANPKDASVAPQNPTSPDLAKSVARTPLEVGAEGAGPDPAASAAQGFGAQGLRAFRPDSFARDPLENAPEPDSKSDPGTDPGPDTELTPAPGLNTAPDPAPVATIKRNNMGESLRSAPIGAGDTPFPDAPPTLQSAAVFIDGTATNTSSSEAGNQGGAESGAEAATRVTRPSNQGDSVRIATATVSGDEQETTERKQASGPSALVAGAPELPISGQSASTQTKAETRGPIAALSHNVALITPADSAAPTGAAGTPCTSEEGPQQVDRAASSVGGKTDSGQNDAPAATSSRGSNRAPGRAPLEKSLPLATGPMEERSVGSKGTKSGPMPQAGDNPNTGPVAPASKTLIGAQRVTASPEARGGPAQVTDLDVPMPRSDQGAEISKPPKGKRAPRAASLSTLPLAPTPSRPAPSLPDGYAQMRGVGVEGKADRSPANLEPLVHSGDHTGNVIQITGPQAPGGIAAQRGASGTAASPLPFTVLEAEPSGVEKRRALDPEAALAEVRGASTPTISTGSAPPLTPHHETARAVMVQLAHSVRANADRAIELRLHPEELGHVRMTFSTDHGGLSVTLTAERSETLDLLRRNIDMLGDELRRIGYGTVDFSFGDDSHQHGGEAETWPSDEVSGLVPESALDHDHIEETEARAMRGLAPAHGGVDMRI